MDGLLKHSEKLGLSKQTLTCYCTCHLEKFSTHLAAADTSPVNLRHCVWFNLSIHFVTRGMEFHHQLTPNSFTFQRYYSGEYVTLSQTTQQKKKPRWTGFQRIGK
ncbi:hypothetical protein KP79_PYT25451 [Mizuhopecten yessoensis]|uniref:Uncharacterized protein n=1 Tax=Mizuhopecten yessoensis TaxID=6573 RepID=A0A210QYP2_MIZYE|nr:hypothetical protein KP79_PYT25451 [Mizuhopecten yessoensis]